MYPSSAVWLTSVTASSAEAPAVIASIAAKAAARIDFGFFMVREP